MAAIGDAVNEVPTGGFSFELCKRYSNTCIKLLFNVYFLSNRNKMLEKEGHRFPKAMKTGTTIAGIVYKDGVVLGADTRATAVRPPDYH